MMMQPVVSIPVPAGGMAELKPGGYHIMLIDLVAPLTEGATIDLTLTFAERHGPDRDRAGPGGHAHGLDGVAPMGSAVPMGSPAP